MTTTTTCITGCGHKAKQDGFCSACHQCRKRCSVCKFLRPKTEYQFDLTPDGYSDVCKACSRVLRGAFLPHVLVWGERVRGR